MCDRPGEDDSEGGLPPGAMAQSSFETTSDPPPAHDGAGEATSRSVLSVFNTEEGSEVHMVEADTLAIEQEAEDQGGKNLPGPKRSRVLTPRHSCSNDFKIVGSGTDASCLPNRG